MVRLAERCLEVEKGRLGRGDLVLSTRLRGGKRRFLQRKFLPELSFPGRAAVQMELFFRGLSGDFSGFEESLDHQGIQRCPFLRNINEPTNFSFSSPMNFSIPVRGTKGPIFEDGPNFDLAFRLFHGQNGVVPLSGKSYSPIENLQPEPALQFNPLAARAATISLSGFGPGGPFSFDSFSEKWKKQKKNSKKDSSSKGAKSSHEAVSDEWLKTGNCPIAKSYRAVSNVLPLVAKALQPPPGMKLKCPPAVVAARAALARTALVKTLRPQPLPEKMLVIAVLGMAANVPLGIWREHTEKFSPAWFAAVHAAVPFIAMLRKSVLMPKTAMAFTIGASILGQIIGSRAERLRLKARATASVTSHAGAVAVVDPNSSLAPVDVKGTVALVDRSSGEVAVGIGSGHCSEVATWKPLGLRPTASGSSSSPDVCF